MLKPERVDVALVSASGSSIYGLGAPPEDSRGWPITIRSPRDPKEEAATVFLRNMSLSTSGSYEKFFWAEGRIYSHIMDPRTGYRARGHLPYRCWRRGHWTARRGRNRCHQRSRLTEPTNRRRFVCFFATRDRRRPADGSRSERPPELNVEPGLSAFGADCNHAAADHRRSPGRPGCARPHKRNFTPGGSFRTPAVHEMRSGPWAATCSVSSRPDSGNAIEPRAQVPALFGRAGIDGRKRDSGLRRTRPWPANRCGRRGSSRIPFGPSCLPLRILAIDSQVDPFTLRGTPGKLYVAMCSRVWVPMNASATSQFHNRGVSAAVSGSGFRFNSS